jgi:hypothetical protein
MKNVKMLNFPEYASHYEFCVARQENDELWFWGAYRDAVKAQLVAADIGGMIIHNVRIQGYKP